jgi:hypothetical protein
MDNNDQSIGPKQEANDRIQRSLNEAKKQELAERYGMTHSYVNPQIDPEVEGDFLNYIEEFERAWATQEETTVWEFLGRPEIRPMEGLTTQEMERELDRIYAIMDENSMALDCINEIEVRELYEFVSGKFMQTECSNMRVPEMTHRFIYEEFFLEKYPFDDSDWEKYLPPEGGSPAA